MRTPARGALTTRDALWSYLGPDFALQRSNPRPMETQMHARLDLPSHAPAIGREFARASTVVLLPGLLPLCTQRCGALG